MHMIRSRIIGALAGCLSALISQGGLAGYTQIFAFGDGLTDNGNLYAASSGSLPPSPPYWQGRFSNDRIAVEVLASSLGASLVDYAWGGATTGTVNTIVSTAPGMSTEVTNFVTSPPAFVPATSLFFVWGGSEDVFASPTPATPAQAAQNLGLEISALAGVGAVHILVPNIEDLSSTPFALSHPSLQAALHAWSIAFDQQLALEIAVLRTTLTGVDIIEFDTLSLFNDMTTNPGVYGLTDVTNPCLVSPTSVCLNPNNYLYWDGVHPTSGGHEILGNALAKQLSPLPPTPAPEPATVALLGLGLAGLVAWRRRKD